MNVLSSLGLLLTCFSLPASAAWLAGAAKADITPIESVPRCRPGTAPPWRPDTAKVETGDG